MFSFWRRQHKIERALRLTPQLRQELKSPLGTLLRGSPDEAMQRLKQLIREEKPSVTISVGDVVSQNMTKSSIPVQVAIVDNKVMRERITPTQVRAERTLNVRNPPGTITREAWTTILRALKLKQSTKVLVEGEEDLLTLAAVLQAPDNALVVYGQPDEGVVAVRVTEQTRERVRRVIEAMEPVSEKLK